jgi:hypothetical protein
LEPSRVLAQLYRLHWYRRTASNECFARRRTFLVKSPGLLGFCQFVISFSRSLHFSICQLSIINQNFLRRCAFWPAPLSSLLLPQMHRFVGSSILIGILWMA